MEAIGRPDIGVYPGAHKPFCREAVHAPYIHGQSVIHCRCLYAESGLGTTGIDGTELLPQPTSPPITDKNGILAIRNALLAQTEGQAWLVATGALTNIGLLFATFPELAAHIKGLSIMGGSVGDGFSPVTKKDSHEPFGNTTFYAEFNIYARANSSLCFGSDTNNMRSATQKLPTRSSRIQF